MIILPPPNAGRVPARKIDVDAVRFHEDLSGNNTFLRRNGGLTGAADGKKGILFAWLSKYNYSSSVYFPLVGKSSISTSNPEFQFSNWTANGVLLLLRNPSGSLVLTLRSEGYWQTGPAGGESAYIAVLASWDLGANKAHMVVNGLVTEAVKSIVDDNADYTLVDWTIARGLGADGATGSGSDFCIPQLYLNLDEYLDVTVKSNMRRFFTDDRYPVDLGSDGSKPTGNQPILFLQRDDGAAVSTFKTNRGTGGDFVEANEGSGFAIASAASTPSDVPQEIVVDGASFDGTNDYIRKGGPLGSGPGDGRSLLISFWVRFDGGNGVEQTFFAASDSLAGTPNNNRLWKDTSNKIRFTYARTSDGAAAFSLTSNTAFTSGAAWHHIAIWIYGPHNRAVFLIDGVDEGSKDIPNELLDNTCADWSIGAGPDGSNKINASLAEFFFQTSYGLQPIWLDLAIKGNRERLRSANGKPVDLTHDGVAGRLGEWPTGIQAVFYHHLDNAEAPANFATNRGIGGTTTLTGTLTTASTSPSD